MDIEKLKARLELELPGVKAQKRMMSRGIILPKDVPKNAKPSGVLILLYPQAEEWFIVFIQRTKYGGAHSGQISFPGGKQEPQDANIRATALREAQEEIGIMSDEVMIAGALSTLYIPVSNFNVYPFIAIARQRPNYKLQQREVAKVVDYPLKKLLDQRIKGFMDIGKLTNYMLQRKLEIPVYKLEKDLILWGATAMITAELEAVLEGIF